MEKETDNIKNIKNYCIVNNRLSVVIIATLTLSVILLIGQLFILGSMQQIYNRIISIETDVKIKHVEYLKKLSNPEENETTKSVVKK